MERANCNLIVSTCLAMLLCGALHPHGVHGDAIVVTRAMSASTIAEVFVEDEAIRVELEVGGPDIEAFKNLLPDAIYDRFKFENPLPFDKRVQQFFAEGMIVLVDGKPAPGEIVALTARKRIQRDEITGKPLLLQPEDAELVIYVELKYTLAGQPVSISIRPPLDPEQKRVTANIGFTTYHRGLPVMDFRYLSQEETLELDWQDPWYSKFQNKNLRRQYDAPLSTFLYVEPFEVRVEVVVRPVDLQRWTNLGITADQIIPVSRQKELKSQVAEFLKDKIAVTIDGQPATGAFDRIHFISRSLRKTGVIYPDEDLHASSATLGVIFVYPIEQLPDSVTMKWALFDEKINQVPATATDEAGGLPSTLTRDDPILEWKNFLTNPTIPAMLAIDPPPTRPQITLPLISLGLIVVAGLTLFKLLTPTTQWKPVLVATLVISIVGAALSWPWARYQFHNPVVDAIRVSENDAKKVTQSLMHNLYHSFDRKEESIVYDQLATCVSGDLLREIYFQMLRRMKLEDQGGAQVKIDTVDILANEVTFPDEVGFNSKVRWNVAGTVGHWGHLHSRANQYEADFVIEPVDGSWKIVSMQITDEANLGSGAVN